MTTTANPVLSGFAQDIAHGLSLAGAKRIPSHYLYDDLGSALFEAITLLPEYGLTRADERLLETHAAQVAACVGPVRTVCELGSGSGKKTRYVLEGLRERYGPLVYQPIDVSQAALSECEKEIGELADVRPICADWMEGLEQASLRQSGGPLLLLFLGSSVGNIERSLVPEFLERVSHILRPGDSFLLGADLIKDVEDDARRL